VHKAVEEGVEAIRLRVIGRTHAESGLSQAKELTPKGAGEGTVSIGDDVSRHPVETIDVVEE
jgi:hypothetical protein